MRFILLEKVPQITADEIEKWKSASDKTRGQMATEILQRYEQPDAMNMWQPFRKSLKLFGIDPKENPFIQFTDKLVDSVHMSKTDDKLLNILVDMHQRRLVDLNHSYLLDPRLYQRSEEDFQYTVNVFETVLDPTRISRYFHDTSNISVDQLYDKGIIKPAGNESTADDTSTIFGTVESWSGENSANDKPQDTASSKKDAIGPVEKRRLQKEYGNTSTLDKIKNPEIGQRVYVIAKSSDVQSMTNRSGEGFYQWTGDDWQMIGRVDA